MFINDEFMLQTPLAIKLYDKIKDLPIIDFHNHLNPQEIYENRTIENISDAWLSADHYKWRLMRFSGFNEEKITNTKNLREQFNAYATSLEKAFLNPLYHWSHLELKRYFGITETLNSHNADSIYDKANAYLHGVNKGPRDLLMDMKVEVLCTTDDINDHLVYHKLLREDDSFDIKVLPTFRPDRLLSFDTEQFTDVIEGLRSLTSIPIKSLQDLKKALKVRLDFFAKNGCKIADHGLVTLDYYEVDEVTAKKIFLDRIDGKHVTAEDISKLNIYLLKFFASWYVENQWTMQMHIGATRNNNLSMYRKLGRDSGFDSLGDQTFVDDLNKLLSELEDQAGLPRMVIYNLNPRDNEALASLCGNFSKDIPGKIQFGPAWWFNDHFGGIEKQLDVYSVYLNLSHFIGMLTDSRSFLSFTRHEYFRRILANYIADKVNLGHIPNDDRLLSEMLTGICYYNSKIFFGI